MKREKMRERKKRLKKTHRAVFADIFDKQGRLCQRASLIFWTPTCVEQKILIYTRCPHFWELRIRDDEARRWRDTRRRRRWRRRAGPHLGSPWRQRRCPEGAARSASK